MDEERQTRWCAALGAIWTALGSVVLAWELDSAVSGREAFVARFGGGGLIRAWLVLLLVVGCGVVWAGLTLRLKRAAPAIEGHRRLQQTVMPLALVFVLVHAAMTWGAAAFGTDAGSVYEGLRRALPSHGMVAVYALGLAALALALEQALLVVNGVFGLVERPASKRWYRLIVATASVLLFVVSVNGVAHFVTGRGLFWRPSLDADAAVEPTPPPPAAERPRVGEPEGDPR